MKPHEQRRLEDYRQRNDVRDSDIRAWVEEQLDHPDPRIARLARQVLDGDAPVWELVDAFTEFDRVRSGAEALIELLSTLDPREINDLRRQAGVDAASLRERLTPDLNDLSAESRYYLDCLGALDDPSVERINARFGIDLFGGLFNLDGLEERLGEQPGERREGGRAGDPEA